MDSRTSKNGGWLTTTDLLIHVSTTPLLGVLDTNHHVSHACIPLRTGCSELWYTRRGPLPATPQDDQRPLAQDTGRNGGLVHQATALRAFAATNPSLNQKSTVHASSSSDPQWFKSRSGFSI